VRKALGFYVAEWERPMNKKIINGNSEEEVMTVREVAAFLKLSQATIYRLAQAKKIPAMKIGRTWRFQKQLVEEWMRQESANRPSPEAVTAAS